MKHSLLIICFLFLIVIVCGCTTTPTATNTNSNVQKDVLSTDKYVVITDRFYNKSTLIGNPPEQPASPVWGAPFIPLQFNYKNDSSEFFTSGIPIGGINPGSVNDSLKVLWGSWYNVNHTDQIGYNLGVFITEVYDLPYTRDNFTIVNISRNGTIYALVNNESITIGPGGQWVSPTLTWTGVGRYVINQTGAYLPAYRDWPVTYEVSFTIDNYGVYNKSLWNSLYGGK